ncbi:MAG: hypothetical protein PVH29_13790 [Candidatus Zixiibacteriota bacterium]|jgi:hypothetical protein
MNKKAREGLPFVRIMMVLSSFTPLFVLWAIRGCSVVPNSFFIAGCVILIIIPNTVLIWRWLTAKRQGDRFVKVIHKAEDNRGSLIVYLFAMLLPLYSTNITTGRDLAAAIVAVILIILLFYHLNLHYMNVFFAFLGYRVFTVHATDSSDVRGDKDDFILLTKRATLKEGEKLNALRISNTVYLE